MASKISFVTFLLFIFSSLQVSPHRLLHYELTFYEFIQEFARMLKFIIWMELAQARLRMLIVYSRFAFLSSHSQSNVEHCQCAVNWPASRHVVCYKFAKRERMKWKSSRIDGNKNDKIISEHLVVLTLDLLWFAHSRVFIM